MIVNNENRDNTSSNTPFRTNNETHWLWLVVGGGGRDNTTQSPSRSQHEREREIGWRLPPWNKKYHDTGRCTMPCHRDTLRETDSLGWPRIVYGSPIPSCRHLFFFLWVSYDVLALKSAPVLAESRHRSYAHYDYDEMGDFSAFILFILD